MDGVGWGGVNLSSFLTPNHGEVGGHKHGYDFGAP